MVVNSGQCFQERQSRHDIVEMVLRHQNDLQPLTSVVSLGSPLPLQEIWHERPLVCGKALTAAKEKQEGVAVPHEDWRDLLGGSCNGETASMRGVGAARTMDEKHGRGRTGACRSPQKCFEPQIA